MSIYIITTAIVFITLIYICLPVLRTKTFDKYFQVYLEEAYNLDDLFPIKIKGKIIPKVDFLDIPYEDLDIEINTKTIRGTIVSNGLSLELIRPRDRKTALYLIKTHYIKTVKPYIKETIQNKKEYIGLINLAEKHKRKLEKIACQTCKHRVQCQISFSECNYERLERDAILRKGIRVDTNKDYELNNLSK